MDGGALEPLGEDEVAVVPVDPEHGLVLVLGRELHEGEPVPRGLLNEALDKAGLAGGAIGSKALLDGSLVRLAPQTVSQLPDGAVFLRDSQGLALGTLRKEGVRGFTGNVRFLPGAANPAAAGLMLQAMALQRQLGQIQGTLEAIDRKLETVLKGVRHGKLATLVKLSAAIDELSGKLREGHELTQVDENKLRDYRDEAKELEAEAKQWLHDLRAMLAQESIPLGQQHATLTRLVRDEHVAFWLRVYIAAEVALAHSTWLLLARSATAEPEWAQQLKSQADAQLQAAAADIAGLMENLDAYLRDPDIASGWQELSFKRKREVRALRRQLLGVHASLRDGLQATHESIAEMLGQELDIPGELSRRDVDPWLIREGVADGSKAGWTAVKEGATGARQKAITSGSELFHRLEEKYLSEASDDSGDEPPS
jgi:hypothetical protein